MNLSGMLPSRSFVDLNRLERDWLLANAHGWIVKCGRMSLTLWFRKSKASGEARNMVGSRNFVLVIVTGHSMYIVRTVDYWRRDQNVTESLSYPIRGSRRVGWRFRAPISTLLQ